MNMDEHRRHRVSPRRRGGASPEGQAKCQKLDARSQKCGDRKDQPQTTQTMRSVAPTPRRGLGRPDRGNPQIPQIAQMPGVRNLFVSSSLCGEFRLDVPSSTARKSRSKSPRKFPCKSPCKSRCKSDSESRCETAEKSDCQSPQGSARKSLSEKARTSRCKPAAESPGKPILQPPREALRKPPREPS